MVSGVSELLVNLTDSRAASKSAVVGEVFNLALRVNVSLTNEPSIFEVLLNRSASPVLKLAIFTVADWMISSRSVTVILPLITTPSPLSAP